MTTESPFTKLQRTDSPILQYTITPSYRIREHQPLLIQETIDDSSAATAPYHLLLDIREMKVEWSDLLMGMADTRDVNRNVQNTLARETLIVTTSPIFKIAMKALGQQQYGSAKIVVFDSIEEAVQYAQQIEAQAA